jgi:hypothetical protein
MAEGWWNTRRHGYSFALALELEGLNFLTPIRHFFSRVIGARRLFVYQPYLGSSTGIGACPSNPSLRGKGAAGKCEAAGAQKPEAQPITPARPKRAKTRSFRGNTLRAHGATNKSPHVCARRRDGEAAGTVSGRERRRCLQIVFRSRTVLLGQTP